MPTTRKRRSRVRSSPSPTKYVVREFLEFGEPRVTAHVDRFILGLADPEQADRLAFNNFVNLTVAGGSSYRTAVEEIAKGASRPVRVNSLSPVLEGKNLIRGAVFSDHFYRVIDDVARNWERMHWWISEGGLSIEVLTPKQLQCKINLKQLTPFERLAGSLFREAMAGGTTVSAGDLLSIARELDGAGFRLKEQLKPSDWDEIARYNQKYARRAIRTFEQAIQNHARRVRRCLSQAKRRFEKACEI